MARRLPLTAILLGVAGLIPFIGCGIAALGVDEASAQQMLWALIAYGAVVLSFLGGVHWGFALEPQGGEQSGRTERWRLLFGALPALVGWVALLIPLALPSWIGLVILIAGFLGTALVESQAARRGLLQPRYMLLRWGLTVVVVAMLITVLTLRILGQHIIF
jgi:Protein of unknown function (DUF3429)